MQVSSSGSWIASANGPLVKFVLGIGHNTPCKRRKSPGTVLLGVPRAPRPNQALVSLGEYQNQPRGNAPRFPVQHSLHGSGNPCKSGERLLIAIAAVVTSKRWVAASHQNPGAPKTTFPANHLTTSLTSTKSRVATNTAMLSVSAAPFLRPLLGAKGFVDVADIYVVPADAMFVRQAEGEVSC